MAAPSACPEHYLGGAAPDLQWPQLSTETRELCFREYAVIHSGVSRTPLAAAEHLTRERVQAARGRERENVFHEEDQLPPDGRARLSDYARSGFDRGHMAPSGDMSTPAAQAESFSLANMVPQDPGSNRCLWEGIESAVRDLAQQEGEVFVVTGPIFAGQDLQRIGGRVLVPTSLYKAVYLPGRREGAAYVAPNASGMAWRAMSLAELRDLTGLAVFPEVAPRALLRAMALPTPRPHNVRGSCERSSMVASADRDHPSVGSRSERARSASMQEGSSGRGSLVLLVGAALFAVVMGVLLYRVLGRR